MTPHPGPSVAPPADRPDTERDAFWQALGETASDRLTAVLGDFPAVAWVTDRELRFRFLSGAQVDPAASDPTRIGRTLADQFGPGDAADTAVGAHRRALAGETVAYRTEHGGRVYEASARPLRAANGDVVGTVGVAIDVTRTVVERAAREAELRDALEALRRRERILRNGERLAGFGSWSWSAESEAATWSDELFRIFGLEPTAGPVPHARYLELVHPGDRARVEETVRRAVASGEPFEHRYRIVRPDGEVREVTERGFVEEDARGGRRLVGATRDVTDALRLEERLRQSQRLEALGQLAGGVAHDFNNVLASVLMYAQALADDLQPNDPRRPDAEEIVKAAVRGAGIAKQLLAFSRAQPLDTEPLDLVAAVRETGRMLRALLPASIALELPRDDQPPVIVRASRAGIAQILVNLAVNARDAMPEGGRFSVDVSVRGEPGGEDAVLRARDTGPGVPPEIRPRIFDPFFTTKPVGRGTGLGLATVYGLARGFGGSVFLDPAAGPGAAFVVTLPVSAQGFAAASEPRGGATQRAGARRRVLVVEDEAPIARVARRILEGAGYHVELELDGAAAAARLRAGERFDVVVTDAAMPTLSGWQLAAEAARLDPPPPVVLMSGYAELSAAPERDRGAAPAQLLQKPFTNVELLAAVRRALEPGASS